MLGPPRAPGRFITVEGVEGSGKSTQVGRLAQWLGRRGVPVVVTAEPDGTPLGLALRGLLGQAGPLEPLTEALLFAAARAEHVARVVAPALARGAVVLSDRHADSTTAYQGYGRGLAVETIGGLNRVATGGLRPDLTVVLDLDVAEGLRRVRARGAAGAGADPFERLPLEFHERVRKGYWAIQARDPGRVVLVDAARPADEVAARLRGLVAPVLGLALEP
jgi:dTMP kinase